VSDDTIRPCDYAADCVGSLSPDTAEEQQIVGLLRQWLFSSEYVVS
jgi:hypothetical protein